MLLGDVLKYSLRFPCFDLPQPVVRLRHRRTVLQERSESHAFQCRRIAEHDQQVLFVRGRRWIWVLDEESASQLLFIDLAMQIPKPAILKPPYSPLQFFEQAFVTCRVHALIPLNQAIFFMPVFGAGDKTVRNQAFNLFIDRIVGDVQGTRRRHAERQVTQTTVSHASGPSAMQCTGVWRTDVVRINRRAGILLKRVVVLVVRQQIRKVDE